jgi:hypothetical protein
MSKVLVVAAVAAALFTAVGSAGAATSVTSEPVSFTLPAGQCPDLPATLSVSGTGTAIIREHTSVDTAGRVHFHLGVTIVGTATDSSDGTYRFNYHQTQSVEATTDFPFVVHITDHFNLVGNGAAHGIHTFFNIAVLVTSPTESEIIAGIFRGDPELCDPL